MSDHDRFCPGYMQYADPCPFCLVIARARADEQEHHTVNNPLLLADLRARVEALETFHNMVWKQDVLALIDGGSDE